MCKIKTMCYACFLILTFHIEFLNISYINICLKYTVRLYMDFMKWLVDSSCISEAPSVMLLVLKMWQICVPDVFILVFREANTLHVASDN